MRWYIEIISFFHFIKNFRITQMAHYILVWYTHTQLHGVDWFMYLYIVSHLKNKKLDSKTYIYKMQKFSKHVAYFSIYEQLIY